MSTLQDFPEKLIIYFTNKAHDPNKLLSLDELKIERGENFVLVPNLMISGKVNEEDGKKTAIIQIDNGLILINPKTKPTIVDSLKKSLAKYSRQPMSDLSSPLI